eukprot:3212613-Amphidinium_carterae.1
MGSCWHLIRCAACWFRAVTVTTWRVQMAQSYIEEALRKEETNNEKRVQEVGMSAEGSGLVIIVGELCFGPSMFSYLQ